MLNQGFYYFEPLSSKKNKQASKQSLRQVIDDRFLYEEDLSEILFQNKEEKEAEEGQSHAV